MTRAGVQIEPAVRGGPGQTVAGVAVMGLALVWGAVFSVSLWTMPGEQACADAPEVTVSASYLPDGKSRLGLTAADGVLVRHRCDPSSRLCRFVQANSPVDLRVRRVGASSGLSDTAIVSARASDDVLVSPAEGKENFAALERGYRGGLAVSLVGLLMGALLAGRKLGAGRVWSRMQPAIRRDQEEPP